MKIEHKKTDYVFSDNPIWVCVDVERDISHGAKARLEISCSDPTSQDRVVFSGVFVAPLRLNASEIARSVAPAYPEVPANIDTVPCLILGKSELPQLTFKVAGNTSASFVAQTVATVLPGGVANQNLRTYIGANSDPFQSRFLSTRGTFFLTNRTGTNVVEIPERELEPLLFLVDELSSMMIVDPISGKSVTTNLSTPGVYALPLDELRNMFVAQFNLLPSLFDIYMVKGDVIPSMPGRSCRIVITKSEPRIAQSILRYRNSLGAFERIALTGDLTCETGMEDESEELSTSIYDSLTDTFLPKKIKGESAAKIVANTEWLRASDLPRLLDLLSSDSVTLISDNIPVPLEVIPSAQAISMHLPQLKPSHVSLSLEIVDRSIPVGPLISTEHQSASPRIFTGEFSTKFS